MQHVKPHLGKLGRSKIEADQTRVFRCPEWNFKPSPKNKEGAATTNSKLRTKTISGAVFKTCLDFFPLTLHKSPILAATILFNSQALRPPQIQNIRHRTVWPHNKFRCGTTSFSSTWKTNVLSSNWNVIRPSHKISMSRVVMPLTWWMRPKPLASTMRSCSIWTSFRSWLQSCRRSILLPKNNLS